MVPIAHQKQDRSRCDHWSWSAKDYWQVCDCWHSKWSITLTWERLVAQTETWLAWITLLGHNSVHKVDELSLQKQFPNVFKRELGLNFTRGWTVIELEEGTQAQVLQELSNSLYTLRASWTDYSNTNSWGELEPVDQSNWNTPVMVVTKRDRKFTSVLVLRWQWILISTYRPTHYPYLMKTTLANGARKSFTKLDLAHAYKQMKVAVDSQK